MPSSVDKASTKMTFAGELKQMAEQDWMTILAPLYADGFRWNAEDEVLEHPGSRMTKYLTNQTPWLHIVGSPYKHCTFDHHVAFNHYGIIPPRCLECWKVTVSPKTYHQLMQLEEIERSMNHPCKCGIEMRAYAPKHYGGYFYNNSLDEGRWCYEMVRKAVNDHIDGGKDIDVILKRGCTEYEMLRGPSVFWVMSPEEEKKFELLQAFVRVERSNTPQSAMVQNNIKLKWAQWAHSNGDMTYKQYNGGESLYPGYVKYHEGDLDAIKADLALARATAKTNMKPEVAKKFQEIASRYAAENDLQTTTMLIHALGAHETNPLKAANFFADTPEELIGEEDQST